MSVTAINPTHQNVVNRFIKADAGYSQIVADTDDNGGIKQERAYDRAYNLFHRLPKREQKNLSKFMSTVGY